MASRTGRKVARFSLHDVNTVAVLDWRAQGLALKGFASGFMDGAYGYVVPYSNGAWHGKVAPFSLQDFSTVAALDLTITNAALKGVTGEVCLCGPVKQQRLARQSRSVQLVRF